ncbi:hypothetical protein ABZT03_12615 [Streptomyces sp. NPDC005574]|uniref:hypothetical protein n=1 Tax=Streptomyces sp. NPDC005574 TaxID=3156891 RepID=UPI0033B9D5FF
MTEKADPAAPAAALPSVLADAGPRAVAALGSLRRVDPRLLMAGADSARLAPFDVEWLASGLPPARTTEHLTARVPDQFRTRPASILVYRLRETPVASGQVFHDSS